MLMSRMKVGAPMLCLAVSVSAQIERAGPYIERSEPRDWLVRAHIALTPATETTEPNARPPGPTMTDAQSDDVTMSPRFDIEQATVFWPVAARAASYEVHRESVTGTIRFSGAEVPGKMTLVDDLGGGEPLHSNAAYAQWTFGPLSDVTATASITIEQTLRCWNTSFDEQAARAVEWPRGDWPTEAASTFDGMLYINGTITPTDRPGRVEELVRRFTGGKPRSQPPVVLAKWIAGELAKAFQVSGAPTVPDIVPGTPRQSAQSVGAIGAVNTIGALEASQRLKGSAVDLALLLTACYRQAGLPARIVLGVVVEPEAVGGEAFRAADRPEPGLYCWVEFALYDEQQHSPEDALTWVPVDIVSMAAGNVGRRAFDQPWPGFGSSETLSMAVPLAYHLHPHQMGALSYGLSPRRQPLPSLWGWNVAPRAPLAVRQALTISVTSPSRTANENTPRPGE
ncbi:MAG: transglutaminase domain-containing protein [Phycisphaerales bacterium]